jgi:hypothetical protein
MNVFSKAVRNVLRRTGYTLVRCQKANGYPVDFTPEEIDVVESVKPYTMTTPERIQALGHALEYLHQQGIPGDIVECGVWRGGSMIAAARALQRLGDTRRTLWLYDTFEGMSAPTEHDVSNKGIKASDKFAKRKRGEDSSDWCYSSLDEVTANVKATNYPADRLRFIKGKVEETLPAQAPERIALLRLDTDWYESTKHEMDTLFPRLVPGGVLIIDDYGDWAGARKAVDEYLAAHRIPMFLGRIDDTARLGIKLRDGSAAAQ